MTNKELEKIKKSTLCLIEDWKSKGKKEGKYHCNHCHKEIPCRIPNNADVTSRGYWDSACICLECGNCNFVKFYPSGKTKSIII
jgi:hypothetical protein